MIHTRNSQMYTYIFLQYTQILTFTKQFNHFSPLSSLSYFVSRLCIYIDEIITIVNLIKIYTFDSAPTPGYFPLYRPKPCVLIAWLV